MQVAAGVSRRAADAGAGRLPAQRQRPGPARPTRRSSATSSSRPARTASSTRLQRRGAHRARRRRATRCARCSTTSPPSRIADLPGARAQRARALHRRARDDGGARRQTSRRAWTTRSSTTPPSSCASRSTRWSRPCSRRSLLVVIVVILFLQTWRASIIPLVAVPVSIVGTFAVLLALGFSINTLSLFGLVLAIGIVVDDAIVVVENVERQHRGRAVAARGDAQGDERGQRARSSPSRWCCAPCSCRSRSSAASPASSTGSSR